MSTNWSALLMVGCLLGLGWFARAEEVASSPKTTSRLTFGSPGALTVEYGQVVYGAEAPRKGAVTCGPGFNICGTLPLADTTLVYGIRRATGALPQVWRASTNDGITFTDATQLFEVPPSTTRWLHGDVALKGETLVLLLCAVGEPWHQGHTFHVFSCPLAGGEVKQLSSEPVYRGQDAFGFVWNEKLGQFVNYQTAYQLWPDKRYPDNMPEIRRVLHLRTSPDGLVWTPGGSFGASGPYLPEDQLIVPDALDPPETEFYTFRAFSLGDFWAGVMVKYASQPKALPLSSPFPHGPFLGCEWWVSSDGLAWERPFRDSSALEGMPRAFTYNLPAPIEVGEELRWVASGHSYSLDRRRLFYACSRANAEVTTKTLTLSGRPLELEVSFEAERREEEGAFRSGYLMAELLDEAGQVIPGFEREKAVYLVSEATNLPLRWGERLLPEAAAGTQVQLKLYFRDMRLYSLAY